VVNRRAAQTVSLKCALIVLSNLLLACGNSNSTNSPDTDTPLSVSVTTVASAEASQSNAPYGAFGGQLVTAEDAATLTGVRPIAGAVTFKASDGTEYSVDANLSGMFSAMLPFGEYTVTGRGALSDDPSTACLVTVGPVFVRTTGENGSVQLVCIA
jgi:hypothetical protein